MKKRRELCVAAAIVLFIIMPHFQFVQRSFYGDSVMQISHSLSHSVTHSLRCKHCGNKSFRTGPSMKPYWSTNHTYNNREALLLFILSIIDLNTTFQVNKNLMSSGTNLILRIASTVYDRM